MLSISMILKVFQTTRKIKNFSLFNKVFYTLLTIKNQRFLIGLGIIRFSKLYKQ